MTTSLRQPEPFARDGAGWYVFDHLWELECTDSRVIDQMTKLQRMVFALNMLRTEVRSGGFDYYFRYTGGNTAPQAVEAAGILGPGWSRLINDACRVMGSPYPADAEPRERVLDRMEEEDPDPDPLLYLDHRLYQLEADEPADEQIDRFIWSNKLSFFV